MITAEEYRRCAADCLIWAAEADIEELRDGFLKMAREWTEKALLAEGRLQPSIELRLVAKTGEDRNGEG
jgi:hypothetical protein